MKDDLFSQYNFTNDRLITDTLNLEKSFEIVDCRKDNYIRIEIYIYLTFV